MRFDLTPKRFIGDQYITTKFLWLPVTIENERRWLERATIKYVWTDTMDPTTGGHLYWRADEFLNK